jgi:16S rRNA (guanine527-N7)-methyltransferase
VAPLRLSRSDERALAGGGLALGVTLDESGVASFASYASLLDTWSAKTNLISCATSAELVARHFLDSLALASLLGGSRRAVDLGSGAGFPGVPLAIALPGLEVTLVESRRRRANFLRTVKRELGLDRVAVVERRAEEGPEGEPFEIAVCRAVWADRSALSIAARWVRPGGRFLWMREGMTAGESGAALEAERTLTYKIGDSPAREVQIFQRRT